MTRRLAIIPARGGSKRLPRKNLLPFLGQPILAHTVQAALASKLFDRLLVSTEDKEIAAAARAAGAEIYERKASLASDTATVADVCFDVLESEQRAGHDYDLLVCLYATAPLRRAEDIAKVVSLAEQPNVNFACAVTSYPVPPHQALRVLLDGSLAPMWPDLIDLRANDVGCLVVDNGSTYAVRVSAFRKTRSFFGPGMRGHLMPRERSVDIDERSDYDLAQLFAEKLAGRSE